jgi:STE24 endopeptidase
MSLAAAIIVFVGAPMLVARIWKTSSLESGELRRELEQMCRDMKVKFRDILVWHSGGVLANAGAMGVIPRVRYLLISDAVLERMSPSEIRAIFGHELGHIRNHHILYMCLFVVGSIMISASIGVAAAITAGPVIPVDPALVEVSVMLTVLVSMWVFVFGHISRRFERQCDVFGAWLAGSGPDNTITSEGGEIFTRALEKVTELNGVGTQSRNWRHGRTAERIRYIYELSARGGSRDECDLNVRKIKFTIWMGAAAGIAATVLIEVFLLTG